ncbi:hypothetical protein [Nioella ostreopsis]|uniref:hypothetical protein n=1 Tax=Nioella ostreopsis TaxID=2448479 RepID=UPI000FDADAD6|nr:hypothetical protein [Nioella ostreopsis]
MPMRKVERAARWNATGDLSERATVFHRPAHILPQKVQCLPVADVPGELIHQLEVVDRGIIGSDIGAEHMAMTRQRLMHPPHGGLGPAMSAQMRAGRGLGQKARQGGPEAFQASGVIRAPKDIPLALRADQ